MRFPLFLFTSVLIGPSIAVDVEYGRRQLPSFQQWNYPFGSRLEPRRILRSIDRVQETNSPLNRVPHNTWFNGPQLAVAGSSWYPSMAKPPQDGNTASALLPINADSAEQTSTTSTVAKNTPARTPAEMPNPNATPWFGLPEEPKVERSRSEIPSYARWADFHDVGESDSNFADFGNQFTDGLVVDRAIDPYANGVFKEEDDSVTPIQLKYGKPVDAWARKVYKKSPIVATKRRASFKSSQVYSDIDNEIEVDDDFVVPYRKLPRS